MKDTMPSKDITLLIAHPDDEALFLWPFLDRVKRIVCASSDRHNISRQWCSERGKCLEQVAELLGCESFTFGNNSEFYRAETRPEAKLKRHTEQIIEAIGNPGKLATHNAWGEYGHIDHLLCHHIGRTVQARTGCELLVTDIATEINWLPITPYPDKRVFGWPHDLDRALFDRIKAIYDARGCWTWAWEPVAKAKVYSL
jgi:LmbE family N-acetylglucosaminyl deacetylase